MIWFLCSPKLHFSIVGIIMPEKQVANFDFRGLLKFCPRLPLFVGFTPQNSPRRPSAPCLPDPPPTRGRPRQASRSPQGAPWMPFPKIRLELEDSTLTVKAFFFSIPPYGGGDAFHPFLSRREAEGCPFPDFRRLYTREPSPFLPPDTSYPTPHGG